MATRKSNQLQIAFAEPKTWGGKRRGAGRKRSRQRPGVPHRRREEHLARHPVHVTLRIRENVLQDAGLRTLRRCDVYKIIRGAFVRGCHNDMQSGKYRICQYSVQRDHMHLIVEADNQAALSAGMKAFAIRVAKGINRFLDRKGSVFDDRYHKQTVKSPRQTRNALAYVILNARKHGVHRREQLHGSETYIDPFSSAHYFDGFTRNIGPPRPHGSGAPVAAAQTWLLRTGWRRHGLVDPGETPGRSRG